MSLNQGLVECGPIALRPFVEALLAEFETDARARHLTLDALVFLDQMIGDAPLLHRLLKDLVGEALRRAPTGTNVSVVVSPRGGQAEFRIADEGAGVTAATLDSAFDVEARGGKLSMTETDDGVVVCLVLPCDVPRTAAIQLTVDGGATRGLTKGKPGLVRSESGIYACAGALVSTPLSGRVARTARTSGRNS